MNSKCKARENMEDKKGKCGVLLIIAYGFQRVEWKGSNSEAVRRKGTPCSVLQESMAKMGRRLIGDL